MDAGPDIGAGPARLGRLPAALGPVVAMGAEGEADLAGLKIAALAARRPDHDGPEDAVVGGRGEDFREAGVKLGAGEMFGHGGLRVGWVETTLRPFMWPAQMAGQMTRPTGWDTPPVSYCPTWGFLSRYSDYKSATI